MIKTILLVLCFLLPGSISIAASTKGGTVACVTEADYNEIANIVANEDKRGFEYVLKSKRCFILKSGLQASILDLGFSVSKVRLYVGDEGYVVWTQTSGINR